jgi:quinoprotein glucose dehydrogenase
MALSAVDAATGKTLWQGTLPQRSTATPMTYRTGGAEARQYVVIATGSGENAELVVFTLR